MPYAGWLRWTVGDAVVAALGEWYDAIEQCIPRSARGAACSFMLLFPRSSTYRLRSTTLVAVLYEHILVPGGWKMIVLVKRIVMNGLDTCTCTPYDA